MNTATNNAAKITAILPKGISLTAEQIAARLGMKASRVSGTLAAMVSSRKVAASATEFGGTFVTFYSAI